MAETEFKHPLDEQNAIERRIQLEGSRDPDHFTMPDGRTLTQVRQELDKQHREEAKNDSEAFEESSRNQSMAEFKRGGSLGITRAGNIVDTTNPEKSKEVPKTTPSTTPTIDNVVVDSGSVIETEPKNKK